MSHIICSHCRERVPVYELPSHTAVCGGYVPTRVGQSPPPSTTLDRLLSRVAPNVRPSQLPSKPTAACGPTVDAAPARHASAVKSPARAARPEALHSHFQCPRCLRSVESAELHRHLHACIRQHIRDVESHSPATAAAGGRNPTYTTRMVGPSLPIMGENIIDVDESGFPLLAMGPRQADPLLALTDRPSASGDAAQSSAVAAPPPPGLRICPLCCKMIHEAELVRHLDLCPENKRSCEYCSMGVPLTHWDDHARNCTRHRQQCYVCGSSVQFAKLGDHMATCSPANRVLHMFHGTDLESARAIMREGFKPSDTGLLGPGVYLSKDMAKAANYGPVILEARVDVGRVCVVDRAHHPNQKNWHSYGFDAAWIPPGSTASKSRLEEHCVFDPARIAVLGVRS